MSWYDDDADDAGGLGPPLPPDDRLWRHPSEVGAGARGAIAATEAPDADRSSMLLVAIGAAMVGAVVTSLVLVSTSALPTRTVERPVVEKVAMTPVVSSPMVRGDQGVAALAAHLGPSIVRLDVDRGAEDVTGSGVVFRDDGLLLTSARLVAGARSIDGVLSDGRRVEAVLVGVDSTTEVAVVDLEGDGHRVAVLGTAEGLEVGATTVVVGASLGSTGGPSTTTGVISALARQVRTDDGGWLHGMIQTDTPISAPWSGAALVDERGAVIGIATASAVAAAGDFGFATPIDLARHVAMELLATGRALHAWLGVVGEDLTAAEAAALGVSDGARVSDVSPGSPADAAGLAVDDVITGLGTERVRSMSSLVVALRERAPGDEVVVVYRRGGEPHRTTVTLAERP